MKVNAPIAFASVLLSVMLWFVVYGQNAPEPVPVRAVLSLDGLDADRFFVRKSPDDVRLDVSLPPGRAKELADQQATASVDLSAPKTGVHDYPVTISPAWLVGYLTQPRPTVRISVEPMDERTVDVVSVVKGALRDPNLRLNERRVSPTQVKVRGPASEVATIREARAFLDLSAIDPNRPEPQETTVIPLTPQETRPPHVQSAPVVVVHFVSVGPTPTTKVATVVPDLSVTYDPTALPDGYRITPETVTLAGKPAVLANVSKVPTEIIRVRGLAKTQNYRVRLLPPAGTMIVGSETVNVSVRAIPAQPPKTEPPAKVGSGSAPGTQAPRPAEKTEPMTEIRPIRRDEAEDFLQLLCDVFGLDFDRAQTLFFEDPLFDVRRKWALFEGREMVSILTTTSLEFGWGRAYGVAGVATRQDRRGEGHAGKLLDRVHREGQRTGEGSGLLFAKEFGLYDRHGFETLDRVVRAPLATAPDEPVPPPMHVEEVRAMYAAWADGHPDRLRRDRKRWNLWKWHFRECNPFRDGYLCFENDTLREGLWSQPAAALPLPRNTEFFGTTLVADMLEIPVAAPPVVELHLMGRDVPGIPQLFMTDQF